MKHALPKLLSLDRVVPLTLFVFLCLIYSSTYCYIAISSRFGAGRLTPRCERVEVSSPHCLAIDYSLSTSNVLALSIPKMMGMAVAFDSTA